MKTQYLLLTIPFLITNFSCKKEIFIDETKAFEIKVKGKITSPEGIPLNEAVIQIENHGSNSTIPAFCCNSSKVDSKGYFEVTLPLEESKVNESNLILYPYCDYQYYMVGNWIQLTKYRDYDNIEKKKKITLERNIIAVPVGSVFLNCTYPPYCQGIVKYKTKNPITKKVEEISSTLSGGGFLQKLKSLPGEPLEVSIRIFKNNELISEIHKTYTLEKFQLYNETLKQDDFK